MREESEDFESERNRFETRVASLSEELSNMRLGTLSAEGERHLFAFEELAKRENAAGAAEKAGNVRIYLDVLKGEEKGGCRAVFARHYAHSRV